MLARCLTSSPRLLLPSAAAVTASAHRQALAARRAVSAAASSSSSSADVPRQARDSEASAVSLRAVRQRDQVSALQNKLAGES